MERSRTELGLFAAGAFAVWLFVWGVILVSKWLSAFAILLLLFCLGCYALRNSE
jgi:hypothetical protein